MRCITVSIITAITAVFLFIASSTEAAKFRIGAHHAIAGSTEVVGHRLGYFKEAGLDYNLKVFKSGKAMRNGVIQGDLDIASTGFAPFVAAISKGAKVTGVAVTASICGLAYIAVKGDSKIKSVKDLKGKSFATSGGGSQHYTVVMHVLPQSGLKSSDLKYVRTKASNRISSILTGVVDSGLVADPQAEIVSRQGKIRKLTSFCKFDNTRMMHISNPQTLKTSPDLYVKYFRGWLKTQNLLKENPRKFTKVYHKYIQEIGSKIDFDVLLAVVKRFKPEPAITNEVRDYLNKMAVNQRKLGWLKRIPDFHKEGLNDSVLRKASASLKN